MLRASKIWDDSFVSNGGIIERERAGKESVPSNAVGLSRMSIAEYRKWAEERIAYLNHALRGLPEDRIRFHTCYGVNFGPAICSSKT